VISIWPTRITSFRIGAAVSFI